MSAAVSALTPCPVPRPARPRALRRAAQLRQPRRRPGALAQGSREDGASAPPCARRYGRHDHAPAAPGETASRLYVAGDAGLIGRLLGEPPTTVQPASRRIETITLPSVAGVTYAFSAEGRLIVGGVVQPVRAAC